MTGQFFETDPTAASRPVDVDVTVWGHRLTLATDTGVFSRARLDGGTAVLFRLAPPPRPGEGGRLLDLGCGYGVIALALAACDRSADVTAVDVNNRALALTEANAARAGLRVRVSRPEQIAADEVFDRIVSNPPIHAGKRALHELLGSWLPRLTPNGTAHLVVGRHLGADPLARWLVDQGYPTTRLGSARGFRVLEVAARTAS